ncbi:hypothetical protein [Flavobacterium sp. GT3R68]|uniref:hypothetical protein n=1 Tax=Flavobacterium sp. GT3R68 TaxID=2594437 RepID=UPI000F86557F|nr:hypothetical protein [Flavobacterium sp. GT3R68]RTY91367.1 hypothetical protein EKL32_19255 [Flavobacterium sp. GSN2]TRW93993.1 hypothetical protein FNW07_03520 [Flavobacterium sp. GT3R68]
MLKSILNLEGIAVLSKVQQKSINGGIVAGLEAGSGGCCVTVVGNVGTDRACGMSQSEAIAEANTVASWGGVRAYWCCASC